jgi:hypothetical protein
VSYRPPACLRTAETPLHAAALVSALSGAHFTRRRQPRVQDRRTFGDEAAILDRGRRASSGTLLVPPRAPDTMSPSGAPSPWSSRAFVAGARPSVPSAPKVGAATWDHKCTTKLTRHKRHQRFVSAREAKASPRDRSRRQTEGGQRGRTRVMLPKTNFPNIPLRRLHRRHGIELSNFSISL